MWAALNHGRNGFGQASLQRDWQFASGTDTTEDFHSLRVLKTST
jgi:hypothetical protein